MLHVIMLKKYVRNDLLKWFFFVGMFLGKLGNIFLFRRSGRYCPSRYFVQNINRMVPSEMDLFPVFCEMRAWPARPYIARIGHLLWFSPSHSCAAIRPKQLCGFVANSTVAERSSLPDSSSGVSSRMWVRIPAVTLVSLSKTLNHNCFSPPRG